MLDISQNITQSIDYFLIWQCSISTSISQCIYKSNWCAWALMKYFHKTLRLLYCTCSIPNCVGVGILEKSLPPTLLIDAQRWLLLESFFPLRFQWSALISYQSHTSHSTFTVKPGEILPTEKSRQIYNFQNLNFLLDEHLVDFNL